MSPVWSSHGALLATAMAVSVSGTVIFLSLLRTTSTSSAENQDSSSTEPPPSSSPPRSCLSSVKKDGRMKKKKVRFAENVKDTDRKTWREASYVSKCGHGTTDNFNVATNLLLEFSR